MKNRKYTMIAQAKDESLQNVENDNWLLLTMYDRVQEMNDDEFVYEFQSFGGGVFMIFYVQYYIMCK